MQTRFYTNKENLIKFLKWVKENIKDAVIIDSKLKGDDVIDLIEKDILTCCGVLVFDKDCEIFKADINDKYRIEDLASQNSISIDFWLCDDSAYSFDFTNYSFYSKTNTKKYPESRIYADGYYSKEETGKRNQKEIKHLRLQIQVRNKINEEKYMQNKVSQSSMVLLIPTVC